jgi:hypothetical protein
VALAELREAHAGRTADRQRAEEAFAKIAGELAGVRQQLGQAEGEAMAFRDALGHERDRANAEAARARVAAAEREIARDELAAWTAALARLRRRGWLARLLNRQ